MIELDLDIKIKKIDINCDEIMSYDDKIINYAYNKNDNDKILIVFIIVDLWKKQITYINPFSDKNLEKINNYKKNNNISFFDWPHSIIQIKESESFMCFSQDTNFVYLIDYKKWKMKLFFCENDFEDKWVWKFLKICSTNFKDPDDNNRFIFSVVSMKDWIYYYNICDSDFNFKDIKIIHSFPKKDKDELIYHVTKKYKRNIFLSNFNDDSAFCNKLNKIIKVNDFYNDMRPFYDKYIKYKNKISKIDVNDSDKIDLYRNIFELVLPNLNLDDLSLKKLFEYNLNMLDFLNILWYDINLSQWEVSILNLDNKSIKTFNTKFWRPAHFEIDTDNDHIYISSHNFIYMDNRYFLGPAGIDKFMIKWDNLVNLWTFVYDKWYRYTSHKLMEYDWKKYIITIWQPNRLIFIDSETMELVYYYDIWWDLLSDKENLISYLNNYVWDSYIWFEIKNKDWIVEIVWKNSILFFSFSKKEIIYELPYFSEYLDQSKYIYKITHLDHLS